MRILLISGHKAGDNLSKFTGYNEGSLNIELVNLLYEKFADYNVDVVKYPTDRDAYKDNKNGKLKVNFRDYEYIFEVHFNAFQDDGSARGTSIQLHSDYNAGISVEKSVLSGLAKIGFKLRGDNGIVRRNDLLNMDTAYNLGVDYALLETCFYDSPDDMKLYYNNQKEVVNAIVGGICSAFGINKKEESDKLYRVQIGAFTKREYAEDCLKKAKNAGFSDAFIKEG